MESMDSIYNQYHKKIFNLALRMSGNLEDAHDITQETFLRAVKAKDSFKGESQMYTWLYRIAKNVCLRFLEKRQKQDFLSLSTLIDTHSAPILTVIPDDEKTLYIDQVKDGCLSGLLRCLSLQQRLAFILHVLLELPVNQVASVLEKSDNAARILVHRAKQNIKVFLCENCSLYDPDNSCRCENLVNFSLKQGWVGAGVGGNRVNTRIKEEINSLRNVISLYQTLPEHEQDEKFYNEMNQLLSGESDFLILSGTKVK